MGIIPSLFLVLLLQVELAILSFCTLGIVVGIAGVHLAFKPQLLVYDNLGITRARLYLFTSAIHCLISAVAAGIYLLFQHG